MNRDGKIKYNLPPSLKAYSVHIDDADNVATAIKDIPAGSYQNLDITEAIKVGQKFSLVALEEGQIVLKYGHPIGMTTQAIKPGELVHVHNIDSLPTSTQGESVD